VVVARTVTPALSLILLPRAPLERRETPPSTIDGTSDLHVELQDEIPHIRVTPDLAPAGRYGLTPGWRVATLSFATMPFALVGGVLAAYASGGVISTGSLVGFLTVFGIAARNGILLIDHFHHLERAEGVPFGPELVIRGARERLAPILMTALATGLALVPLAISGDIAGAEIGYPMALVILGGLVTSTLLNLFVVPALCVRLGRSGTGTTA
jgi:Cu/Ag efflux pump CusA